MSWMIWGRPQIRIRWRVALLPLALLGVWQLIAGLPLVRAHALLIRSAPEANAELIQPPATIELWFSEPLEADFSGARLLNSLGEEIPTGAVSLDPSDPTHLTLTLGQLEPGIYTVAWQTLSQVDGHEWSGSFPFTVLNADGTRPAGLAAPVGAEGRGELPTPGQVISRWFALLGGLLFFGAPLFQQVVAPANGKSGQKNSSLLEARSRELALRAVWIAGLAIILASWWQIVLQALRLDGLGLLPDLLVGTRTGALALARQVLVCGGLLLALGLPQSQPFRGGKRPFFFVTAVGGAITLLLLLIAARQGERVLAAAVLTVVALGLALVGWASDQDDEGIERRVWLALLLLAAALLLSFSIGSHAGAGPGSIWAILGDYFHLLAAAVWVGGLVLLPSLIWQIRQTATTLDRGRLLPLVRRFSYLASFAVFVLVVTGVFNSLVQLPNLASLWDTPYGRALLVKLFLILLALEVAFFNNRLVHRQAGRLAEASGLARFNRLVALETVVALGITLSVAVLVQTPTPRSLTPPPGARPAERPFNTIAQADDLYIHLQVTPNQAGYNRFWAHLYHPDNSPIGEVQLARLIFNDRQRQLGQAGADLTPLVQNTFAVEGAYINQAGIWDLSVYVRRRGLDDVLTEVSLEVPAPAREVIAPNPWQNPIPALPPGLAVAGGLVALGVMPLLWLRPLRASQPQTFLALGLSGGVLVAVGLVIIVGSALDLLAVGPARADSIAAGATLFQENCAICHGLAGLGDGPQAAGLELPPGNLRAHVPLHADGELYGFISQGFPNTAMPAFEDQLTAVEIWHLVNYLRDQFGGGR